MSRYPDLAPRFFSAVIGGMIIILSLLWNEWGYFAVFLFISCMTMWEFYRLMRLQSYVPIRLLGVTIGGLLFVLTFLIEADLLPSEFYVALFPLASFVFLIKLYKKSDVHPFINIALFYLGILYVAVPFALINILVYYSGEYSYEIIMGLLFLTWANDVGAYFSGILFGRRKLFERISPNKSWEGSIGGAITAALTAVVIGFYFEGLNPIEWISVSIIVVIAGTYGDLVESHFKRSIQIKDSGTTIPGHGGFLDRFDSFLIAVPFVVVFLKLF
ncbi:phosphatidate cytidylyltransferase [Ekhidna sp.]|uniref:phosphatidate cytidylyltransferase n=1 Tax=Ekhidna sp. TaxID=2608089 RepID=UPI003B5B63B7